MNHRITAAIAVAALLAAAAAASAHHNMSAVFDFNQRFTRSGTLTKVDWRNPHIELLVEAKSDAGEIQLWRYEGPSPGVFRSRTVGKAEVVSAIGKTVIVEASRARDGSLWGLIRMLTLPDGTVLSLCPQNC